MMRLDAGLKMVEELDRLPSLRCAKGPARLRIVDSLLRLDSEEVAILYKCHLWTAFRWKVKVKALGNCPVEITRRLGELD